MIHHPVFQMEGALAQSIHRRPRTRCHRGYRRHPRSNHGLRRRRSGQNNRLEADAGNAHQAFPNLFFRKQCQGITPLMYLLNLSRQHRNHHLDTIAGICPLIEDPVRVDTHMMHIQESPLETSLQTILDTIRLNIATDIQADGMTQTYPHESIGHIRTKHHHPSILGSGSVNMLLKSQ